MIASTDEKQMMATYQKKRCEILPYFPTHLIASLHRIFAGGRLGGSVCDLAERSVASGRSNTEAAQATDECVRVGA
jgi:hypothetical protein